MCGICGSCGFEDGQDLVRLMNREMIHRGPDSEGYINRPFLNLGIRRLKIIDMVTGDQPIYNENRTIAVVLNGEIYNFRELYNELQSCGHHFASQSDTEVIVHSYEEWGVRCVERLQGMFAFAVYDSRPGPDEVGDDSVHARLFLARDRLGIKPLYYWQEENHLLFASELRALLSSGKISRRLSIEGLYTYLAFGSVQEPLTIISDVYSVPPASYLQIEVLDSQLMISQSRYWSPPDPGSTEPSSEEIRLWLSEATRAHLISDVPLGSFLSGGIDSGSIVALSSQILTEPLRTFTLAFDDWPMDERNLAEVTARRWQTAHSVRTVTQADIIDDLPHALASMDQPTVDGINSWYVSREAKRSGLTVALSGLGGDELFAGYPSFQLTRRLKSFPNPLPWLKLLPKWESGWPILSGAPDTRRKLAAYLIGQMPLSHPYFAVRGLFTGSQIEDLLTPATAKKVKASNGLQAWHEAVSQEIQLAARYDPVGEVSWLELSQYTRSTLLRDTDMMSMAHSLEVRVPFLDHLLVERVMSICGEHKRDQPYPKSMLISAMKGYLPSDILGVKKRTFTFPFELWLGQRAFGELDRQVIHSLEPWLNPIATQKISNDFQRGRMHWSRPWALYVLSNWIQENL